VSPIEKALESVIESVVREELAADAASREVAEIRRALQTKAHSADETRPE
jgi:hypothetical protein